MRLIFRSVVAVALALIALPAWTQAPAPAPAAAQPPASAAGRPQQPPLSAAWQDPASLLTLPDMPLHDPFMVADKASATYYLYTSNVGRLSQTQGVGTMVYTSKDLKNWTHPKAVFVIPPGIWANAGGWAPEVHRWKGRWYLFTTLHNESTPLPADPAQPKRKPIRRGTIIAVSDTLQGPFKLINNNEPVAPSSLATLDGGLYVDKAGRPWFVYAHEWTQITDGTIEAVPLKDDLTADGPPRVLFKASDAPWAAPQIQGGDLADKAYVTDGAQFYRTKDGHLIMLWSTWAADGYVEAQARSKSGEINGPWEQLGTLLHRKSGHGMLFNTFDGKLMLVVHRPFSNARGKLYEMRDAGDRVEIIRERTDLDGDPEADANLYR